MDKLHSDKSLQIKIECNEPAPIFNGEAHDLQEMIGNVLDNACKWAKSIVNIRISKKENFVEICIEDDGVGLDPSKYDSALKRGIKLDEITPWVSWLGNRSEEHTSELQSLSRISYADFCLKKKK